MKIVIIKLGALGDVVRTTPILSGIKEKYPNSEITWVTKPESEPILKDNQFIGKLVITPTKIIEEYDILYNFDIDEQATKLAKNIKAGKKFGFYEEEGFPAVFNEGAEYYLNTLFDDELKKTNRKTYQEMIFEIAGLPYKKQQIIINISEESKKFAEEYISKNNLVGKKILGLNIGSSSRWPSKAWHIDRIKEFMPQAKEKGYELLLLGGSNETNAMDNLKEEMNQKGVQIYGVNTHNSLHNFFALINACDKIVCADTLALHIALGLKKPVIAMFFCTSPWEIEDYGLAKKVISPMLEDFFPEKMDQYSDELVKSISVEEVINLL